MRVARAALALVIAMSTIARLSSLQLRPSASGATSVRTVRTSASEAMLRDIAASGAKLDARERDAVRVVIERWSSRPDLRSLFSLPSGAPDLQALLSWAGASADADAIRLVAVRSALSDVSDALGIVPPNGDVLPPLLAVTRARARPSINGDDAMFVVARALAERADLHPNYIGEVERGEKTISVDALLRIAEAMKVRLGDLVREIDRSRKLP